MGHAERQHQSRIQETRPAAGAQPEPEASTAAGKEPAIIHDRHHRGWQLAGLAWAIMFLFLALLMVLDLIFALFHR